MSKLWQKIVHCSKLIAGVSSRPPLGKTGWGDRDSDHEMVIFVSLLELSGRIYDGNKVWARDLPPL